MNRTAVDLCLVSFGLVPCFAANLHGFDKPVILAETLLSKWVVASLDARQFRTKPL